MDGFDRRLRLSWSLLVLVASLPACSPRISVEDVPGPEETMSRVGRRLSHLLSVQELSALAPRGDRLLEFQSNIWLFLVNIVRTAGDHELRRRGADDDSVHLYGLAFNRVPDQILIFL